MRKMSSFSGKGLSTNSIAWKRWMLWNKSILQWKFRWWGYKLVGCCKLSFYANESCRLFLAMIEMTRHVHRVFGLWQWCNFSGIVFRVFIHAYSIIVEYDIKRKYPEEYPTVDKVGTEKKRGNSVSCRINRLLISYLISKQARVTAFLTAFLFSFFHPWFSRVFYLSNTTFNDGPVVSRAGAIETPKTEKWQWAFRFTRVLY